MTCHGPSVEVRRAYEQLCAKSKELCSQLLMEFHLTQPDIGSWPYLQCWRHSCNYPIKIGKHPHDLKCSECGTHVSVRHFPYQSDEARRMDIQRKVEVILTFSSLLELKIKQRFVKQQFVRYAKIVVNYLKKQLRN